MIFFRRILGCYHSIRLAATLTRFYTPATFDDNSQPNHGIGEAVSA